MLPFNPVKTSWKVSVLGVMPLAVGNRPPFAPPAQLLPLPDVSQTSTVLKPGKFDDVTVVNSVELPVTPVAFGSVLKANPVNRTLSQAAVMMGHRSKINKIVGSGSECKVRR